MTLLIALILATGAALLTVGLFVWGVVKMLREHKPIKRLIQFASEYFYPLTLKRAEQNPILSPTANQWEADVVLNPAAFELDGRTHLFYRAIGTDGVSRIGYASSEDGFSFNNRLPYPVYALLYPGTYARHYFRAHPGLMASGGSWAGTEDPRAYVFGDRIYLSFHAFAGWSGLRIAMVSISLDDFRAQRWNWSEPVYLSPPGEIQKNWVLFPVKIRDKIAILHSVSPTPEIEYRDSIEGIGTTEPYIKSLEGPRTKGAKNNWDTWVRGAGPPPIRTALGWLLLYHGTNRETESHKYKLGAMLLDAQDPTKVIARSVRPVLEPEAPYETGGAKPGIVYSCGAVVKDGELRVYYGAADNHICVASAPLAQFLDKLIKREAPKLTRADAMSPGLPAFA